MAARADNAQRVTEDFIQNLQDDIYFALLGDAEISGVSIFRRRTPLPKDEEGNPIVGDTVAIDDQINQVLAGISQRNGQSGMALVVMLPDVVLESAQNMTLPTILKWKVRAIEAQMFNESAGGTGLTSSQVALHVAQFLQTRQFRMGNPLRCDPAKAVEEIALPGFIVHEINGECAVRVALRAKCAEVIASQDNAQVTLSSTTEGARIYYTLDGGYPGSGNAAALLYTGPISLDPGSYMLRCAAEADAMQSSNDRLYEITAS